MTRKACVHVEPPADRARAEELGVALGAEVASWLRRVVTSPPQRALFEWRMPEGLEYVRVHHDALQFTFPDDMGSSDPELWVHWIERFDVAEPVTLAALCELYGGRMRPASLVRALWALPIFVDAQSMPSFHAADRDDVVVGRCGCDVCELLRSRAPAGIDEPHSSPGAPIAARRVLDTVAELADLACRADVALATFDDAAWHRDATGPADLDLLRNALIDRGLTLSPLDTAGLVRVAVWSWRPSAVPGISGA